MDDLIKEQFERSRKAEELKKEKFPPDFPKGNQIAPGVYQQDGFIIVGDKY